jgi:hypothetical protein
MQQSITECMEMQVLHKAAVKIQALARLWLAKRRLKRMKSVYIPARVEAFQDLLQREKQYVENLSLVVSQYMLPLRNSLDKQLRERGEDYKAVFGNIEQLVQVHQTILRALYELAERHWPSVEGIGDILLNASPHLRVYGPYVNNFKFARDTLFSLIQNVEK